MHISPQDLASIRAQIAARQDALNQFKRIVDLANHLQRQAGDRALAALGLDAACTCTIDTETGEVAIVEA
jgi:hypothetical protein